jgi:hypothetical protein
VATSAAMLQSQLYRRNGRDMMVPEPLDGLFAAFYTDVLFSVRNVLDTVF